MAPRRLVFCLICGDRLQDDRVGNYCGKCCRMIRSMQRRDSRAAHMKGSLNHYDAYNGLGPAARPRDIRYRAAQRAQQSEAAMDCILRRAAALGMQYGEYMIYLKTQGEKQP